MLLGLYLQLQLCRALGFMLCKGRFKNPPVIKMLEGGSELHTPRAGRAAGPRAEWERKAAKQPQFKGSRQECKV